VNGRGRLAQLSDHLYCYQDTCNCYVVTKGKKALVIDCGAAQVRKHLKSLGVDSVEWLLFTHHHRDQSQGAELLLKQGAKVAVPEYERFLFEHAADYMQHRWVYDSYNDRNTAFTRIADLPVNETLQDYETFKWRGYEFQVMPTPGHTQGSVTLLANIDGRNVAFTGDLMREEGRFHSLHDLENSYGGCEGADLTAYSAVRLLRKDTQLVCPSHGELIEQPDEALENLLANARLWYKWKTTADLPCLQRPVRVSDHLVAFPHACCSWYAIIADNGRALLVDHGAVDGAHFGVCTAHREFWETHRYVDHGIHELKESFGLESVEVVMPTHYHDDHVAGLWYLQRHHGTEVWCVEQLKEVLEHPERYSEMCLFPKPAKVNRTFADGEQFEWNGYRFQIWHFPSQTEYHQLLAVEVDAKRVLFSGDSFIRSGDHLAAPVIFRNYHRFDSHSECAEKLALIQPHLVAPGHGDVWAPRADELPSFRQHVQQIQTIYRRLVPQDQRWRAINPFWARIIPYQVSLARGGKSSTTVRIVNFSQRTCAATVQMVGPAGISFSPKSRNLKLGPEATRQVTFELSVSQRYKGRPRVAVAVDVEMDGEPLGQVAEAFVSVG